MQTIRIGDAKWETIEAGNRIELTAYGTAIVQLHSAKVGGSMLRQENLVAGQSMTFGPFLRPVRIYMSAGTGAIEFEEREGDAAGEDARPLVMVGSTLTGEGAAAVRGALRYVTVSALMTGEQVRAAIQASLDIGRGVVTVVGSGDGIVELGDTIIAGSYTTLIIDASLHLRWPAGKAADSTAQRAMIENRRKTATRYDCTVTSVGRVAMVTRAGHGKAVGDAIMLMGAATRGYNGAYRVESVPSADTFTVLLDSVPAATPAVPNTYFTSVVMCDADEHTYVVINGTIDGNGGTIPVVNNTPTMCVILSCVLNSWVRGTGSVIDPQGYAITVAGGTNCGVDAQELNINNPRRDGVHFQGPIRRGLIRGVRGYSYDDFTSLTTGDYALYNEMTEGEFEGIDVEDINCDVPITGAACAQFGKSRWWFSDINYRRIRGSVAGGVIHLKKYTGGLPARYQLDKVVYVGNLTGEKVTCRNSTGENDYASLLLVTGDPTLKNIYIDKPVLGNSGCRLFTFNRINNDWTFDQMFINGFDTKTQGLQAYSSVASGVAGKKISVKDSSPFVRANGTGFSFSGPTTAIQEVIFENVSPVFGGNNATLLAITGGAYDYVGVNATPDNAANNGSGQLVYWNGGTVRVFDLNGCRFNGAQLLFGDVNMDVSNGTKIKLTGNHCRGNTKNLLLNKGVTILADQHTEANAGAVYDLRGSGQVYTIIEGTLDSPSTAPFSFAGGATANLTSPNRRVDVTNAGLNRFTGGALYNTNAAAGTLGAAGPVICQGTATNSWKLAANPSLAY